MAYRFCFGVHVYEFAPASEIIVQESADFRAFIALDACENVYGLGQFSVSEGWRILSRIDQRFPFSVSRVQQIKFDAIAFLCMGCPKDLSAAVITLHYCLFIPGLSGLPQTPRRNRCRY